MKQSISRFDLNHINRPLLNNSVYLNQSTAISVHLKSHGGAVRTSNIMQRTVCGVRIVEGKSTAHVAGRHTLPYLIVLMPEYWSTMPRRLVQQVVVEELNIGTDEVFNNVKQTRFIK